MPTSAGPSWNAGSPQATGRSTSPRRTRAGPSCRRRSTTPPTTPRVMLLKRADAHVRTCLDRGVVEELAHLSAAHRGRRRATLRGRRLTGAQDLDRRFADYRRRAVGRGRARSRGRGHHGARPAVGSAGRVDHRARRRRADVPTGPAAWQAGAPARPAAAEPGRRHRRRTALGVSGDRQPQCRRSAEPDQKCLCRSGFRLQPGQAASCSCCATPRGRAAPRLPRW